MGNRESNKQYIQKIKRPAPSLVKKAFSNNYPPSDYDPINRTQDGKTPNLAQLDNRFNLITNVTSFLGLPNRLLDIEQGRTQSWKNIGKNFIGWEETASKTYKIIHACIMPFVILKNLIVAAVSLPINIIKLVTEFLPALGVVLCKRAKETAKAKESLGWKIAYGAAVVGENIFRALLFIGRAVTSPIKGIRAAYHDGTEYATSKDEAGNEISSGKWLGIALAAFSAAITITVYTIVWPLAIKAIAASVVAHLPAAIINAAHAIGPYVTPIGQAFDHATGVIAAALKTHSIVTGLSAFVGATIALAAPLKASWAHFKKWQQQAKKEKQSAAEKQEQENHYSNSSSKMLNRLSLNNPNNPPPSSDDKNDDKNKLLIMEKTIPAEKSSRNCCHFSLPFFQAKKSNILDEKDWVEIPKDGNKP